MIAAYHVIFGAYGFWLPNDPRGSWSQFVGACDLFRYGPATKTVERRSLAGRAHDTARREIAKNALNRMAVKFTGEQARAVGRGFANYAMKSSVPVLAAAILPNHVHLVLGRTAMSVERVVVQLKAAATRQLIAEGIHPFPPLATGARPAKAFARGEWKVFLDAEDIPRAIAYVESNPTKEGKACQCWSFVTAPS